MVSLFLVSLFALIYLGLAVWTAKVILAGIFAAMGRVHHGAEAVNMPGAHRELDRAALLAWLPPPGSATGTDGRVL